MAEKHLGPEFEIHGGGLDLRFPHHENEIAQSQGAGRRFAHVWAHNGMLQLDEEKMSKSTGNIVSLRDVLDRYGADAILVFFLGAHWRSPLDYSDEAMESAKAQAEGFRTAFRVAHWEKEASDWSAFEAALDDDFNTPAALAILHEWRSKGHSDLLGRGLSIFGLSPPVDVGPIPEDVRSLADQREAAREAKDFDQADRLREEIAAHGWEVQDVADGYRLIPTR
jgi:cysteinyl-tRNA synthetase